MWKKWTKLCQANVDHYNKHKTMRLVLLPVYCLVVIVGFGFLLVDAVKN